MIVLQTSECMEAGVKQTRENLGLGTVVIFGTDELAMLNRLTLVTLDMIDLRMFI